MLKRKITRTVNVGGIAIGGGNPIVIQSMCNTDTRDIDATVKQITELANEGCQIVRVAVVDMEAAKAYFYSACRRHTFRLPSCC